MRLSLEGTSVAFGSTQVLCDLALRVDPGEAVAIMGPSGSGKTTLLSVVAGMRAPDSGTRRLEGDEGSGATPTIAWVFQTSPVLMRRTALDNVALGARIGGARRALAEERAGEALDRLGIGHRADQPLYRLSGGERQRVVIARALAGRADLLIADEPTASLDPATKDDVTGALLAVADAGGTVLVATHDSAVAERCHRILELRDGALHQPGPVSA